MELTIPDIKRHIAEYKGRIEVARLGLANLPKGRLPLKEHKKRERQHREYRSETEHCEQLIRYAREGIAIRLKEAS
jgi:hypothetical protein